MKIVDFYQQNKNGQQLFYWHRELESAKAVVCIVHGLGEHIGRYGHVAEFFELHGIATLGFDQQGHGRTAGVRGHAEGLESMLDDISGLLELAESKYPNIPVFLYGHSMGGNLVLNHMLRRNPPITGLIASAPWIRLPKPPSAALVLFGKMMSHISPKMTRPSELDVNGLSIEPLVVKAYQQDRLVHDQISVKAGTELNIGAIWLDKFAGPIPRPTLLMHGELDYLTSPLATAEFAKRITGDVTWKPWPGLKHEIHNEPQQTEVLRFLVEWMERFI